LEEHQQFQTKLLSLQQTINEKDATIIEFAAQLHKAQHILQTVVDEAKEKLAAIARAKKGKNISTLIKYISSIYIFRHIYKHITKVQLKLMI